MKLSLCVPCYNEQDNIKLFFETVKKIFRGKIKQYEIIFINDGSTDNTLLELKKLIKSNENIKIINFSRNFGKEAGIYAGLKEAKGDYVTIIDADLQQDPKYVVEMVNFLDEHEEFDSVVAYQKERIENKVLIFFKNSFYKIINRLSEADFVMGASDFRTLRKEVVNAILSIKEYYRFSKGIFSWVGFNNYYLPYTVKKRTNGKTKWSFCKLFKYALDGIISFTNAPLRLATFIGFIVSLLSLIYLVVVIIQKVFFSIEIAGYATIVTLILFLGGIQLLCIGIIGEYLGRTYVETKNRPIYIIKDIIESKKGKNDVKKN